ncbi:hypothetical protein GQ44DRAFT_705019 [Phaeosphaeriaceae sp. PMI808]|nr:hypothetical protein GQ44DRAFT_705019 [Phaeosphaeriaceae sp. PMI808]
MHLRMIYFCLLRSQVEIFKPQFGDFCWPFRTIAFACKWGIIRADMKSLLVFTVRLHVLKLYLRITKYRSIHHYSSYRADRK